MLRASRLLVGLLAGGLALLSGAVGAESPVSFDRQGSQLDIRVRGKPFAAYVWEDAAVRRPFFTGLHAPNGKQVTRPHPPVEGKDATDHAAMHPGLWLAFGDLGGADFWRNAGTVRHVEFVDRPAATREGGAFAVRNEYLAGGKTVCEEVSRIRIAIRPEGYRLDWTSEFTGPEDFAFGDQEEMGLGVRVATGLTVRGGGKIMNSAGSRNEKEVWGKQADWCDYSGLLEGEPTGVTLMPHPDNFQPSWFHARDYGVLVANPFGQNAFTGGEKCRILVRKGETFRLRFAVLVHAGRTDLAEAYRRWVSGQ